MDSKTLSLGLIGISLAGIICIILLRAIFRKTIVAKVSTVVMIAVTIIADLAFFIGATAIIHLTWAIPVSILMLIGVFKFMKDDLTKPLDELTNTVIRLSEGDLGVVFNEKIQKRKDELGKISTSISKLVLNLKNVIQVIQTNSNELVKTSRTLKDSSINLREGSGKQATSSEEISASVEEISATIRQNTDNSQVTEKIAIKSAKEIISGNELVLTTKESMETIANKIQIVNDIAFQTNLLALNAAVEAARAGEYGRGFAVVAAEVRKLAEKSKLAADEIDKLSKEGVGLAQESGNKLSEIVPDIEKTAHLIQEVTASSLEQSSGAEQITQAVSEFSQIAQEISHASEELNTNSESLAQLANEIDESLSFFKINKVNVKKDTISNKPYFENNIEQKPPIKSELLYVEN